MLTYTWEQDIIIYIYICTQNYIETYIVLLTIIGPQLSSDFFWFKFWFSTGKKQQSKVGLREIVDQV